MSALFRAAFGAAGSCRSLLLVLLALATALGARWGFQVLGPWLFH